MPDFVDEYPPEPTHNTNKLPNAFWPDGSFFQYDLPPRYVLSEWEMEVQGGIYDIPRVHKHPAGGGYTGWTMWVDKFMKDWRFTAMSDTNARAQIFPEVHDPWQFTEYVFNGNKRKAGFHDAAEVDVSVVQPPLTNPFEVNRTYKTEEGVTSIETSELKFLNDQPATSVPFEHTISYDFDHQWISDATKKEYWESELRAMNWTESTPEGDNKKFTRQKIKRRHVRYALPKVNSGVRLYRQPVWMEAARWGQSQNIPERIVTHTAPREFFRPDGIFTGRIVPSVKVEWGIPLYDNITNSKNGQQRVIRYDNYGSGSGMKNTTIALWDTTVTGVNGKPESIFTYTLAPSDMNTGDKILLPKTSLEQVRAGAPKYLDNDLVHRGCQFWQTSFGEAGKARCQYFVDYADQFQVRWEDFTIYTDPDAVIDTIAVAQFDDTMEDLEVTYETGTTKVLVTECGKVVEYIKQPGSDYVTSIKISQASGTLPVYPLKAKSLGGFVTTPDAEAKIRVRRFMKNRPSPHGVLCGMHDGATEAEPNRNPTHQYKLKCAEVKHRPCKFYTPVGRRTVASYTMEASNGAEWANMQRGLPPGYKKGPFETANGQTMLSMMGSGFGYGGSIVNQMAFVYGMASQSPDPYTAGFESDDFARTTIEWTPEVVPLQGKETYYDTATGLPPAKDPVNALRVRAGTGLHAIDWKDQEPYTGVDTVFFAMVNQANYRLMANVQHCYNADRCNPIIGLASGPVGWRRGRYSNIDFTAHALRMPGYPGFNGTDRQCHYGDGRCPHNRLDRRAVEYDNNYRVLLTEILRPFRVGGIFAFEKQGLVEAFINADGKVVTLTEEDVESNEAYKQLMCVAVRPAASTPPLLGHYQPILKDPDGNDWRVFFYYDIPSWEATHTDARVSAHIVQFDDKDQAVYIDIPTSLKSRFDAAYGVNVKVPWLVELYMDYRRPEGNIVSVTNNRPFAGGRHPEYRDHSKRGRQLSYRAGGAVDRSFREGATDSNQFGGPIWNRAPVTGTVKMGYWTEKYGQWILDGRKIGVGEPYVEAKPRMRNKPGVQGNAHPVHGTPGLKIEDSETPNNNRTGDWAATGHTYSNDTKAYLEYLRSIWDSQLPVDPDTGEKININPPGPLEEMLPRERFWYQCDVCGIDFSEEEANTLVDTKRADDTPLYPLPEGFSFNKEGAMCSCPRNDGGVVRFKGSYTHFMKTYSRGYVDIWAPPGTTVKHDCFAWKNPTMITRTHQDHMLRKLGVYHGTGGGYAWSGLTPSLEAFGRLPVTTARGYQAGLSRQITAPWASPGETVKTARDRVATDMQLQPTDLTFIQKAGTAEITIVEDPQGTVMDLNDTIYFWRQLEGGDGFRVGLPVSATTPAPTAIMNEAVVKNDKPRPKREDFPATNSGDKQFNQALKSWLIDVVYGSLQQWSSSVYAEANLLAQHLQAKGIQADLAKPVNPKTGDTLEVDERIIAPYLKSYLDSSGKPIGNADQGGLKIVTLKHMKRLRNRLLPMLAYDMTAKTYTAGGDFTDRAHAANLDRGKETRRPMPMGQFGIIPPQVMAATSTGRDMFFEWELGDLDGTKARAYYPVGTTWWRMNQRIGQIKRAGGNNSLHLDNSAKLGDGTYADPNYTGDTITSTVTMFLHGRIPMDKEILRAVLVYTAGDPPEMRAIGCQGQYTGMVGHRDMTGNVFGNGDNGEFIDSNYRGHSYCFWQHYHPFTTNHEMDGGGTYFGADSRNHVLKGHENPEWFLAKGTMNNPNTPWLLDHLDPIDLQAFTLRFDYVPMLDGDPTKLYHPHVQMLGKSFVDASLGWNLNQNFFSAWDFGEKIVHTATEHEIWKEIDYQTYDDLIKRYYVRGKASVNQIDAIQDFEYLGEEFRTKIWPRQQQAVPGWLNFLNYDNSGRFSRNIKKDEKVSDPDPGELLADSSPVVDGGSGFDPIGGGNGIDNAGSIRRVLNVTDKIRELYNDRVTRYYRVKLGVRYNELFELVKSKTDTNLGLVERFHYNDGRDGWYDWNYRYMRYAGNPSNPNNFTAYGMWLTDPFHMPPIGGDNEIPGNNDVGDPIIQTEEDRRSRVADVSGWDDQGLEDTDPAYLQYHPFSLCRTNPLNGQSPPLFMVPPVNEIKGSATSVKPVPADHADYYWRMVDDQFFVHSFTMDLRQVPYETERREWREIAPRIDNSTAVCTNKVSGCLSAVNNWTVSELYANSVSTWGIGVIPSFQTKKCPLCGAPFPANQIQYIDGDGVTTVHYDDSMENNPIVNAIEVDVNHGSWNPSAKHGFAVEYFNSVLQEWRGLFVVDYDELAQKFQWLEWNGTAWAVKQASTLPNIFRGCEGNAGVPKDPAKAFGCHFTIVTAEKVRFRVFKPAVVNREITGSCTSDSSGQKITVPLGTLTGTLEDYINRTIVLTGPDSEITATISGITAGSGTAEVRVSGAMSGTFTTFKITWKDYIARCTKFRVYGFPYLKGEVVITPPGIAEPALMAPGMTKFQLNSWPSQISRIHAFVGEDIEIPLTQATGTTNEEFHWTVDEDAFDKKKYFKIRTGKWFYDFNTNRISVPAVYLDPKETDASKKFKPIWDLNEALYEDPANGFAIKTLPSRLVTEYFVGLGVPVNVTATAVGTGPSYQLEREAIQFIWQHSEGDTPPPASLGLTTDQLPQMGKSAPLKALNGQQMDLRWHVYNHDPMYWKGAVNWLVGDELPPGAWGANSVMSFFTGGNGFNTADLKGGPIGGFASGPVTLYGTPNTLLAGEIVVYAKAITETTYNLPGQGEVVTRERTGGYRSGAIVFGLEVADTVSNGRTGISCGIPTLLIWARERNLDEPL